MNKIKELVVKLQSLEPEWLRQSTWTEAITGLVVTVILALAFGPLWSYVTFNTISFVYEYWLDPNGWSWDDYGQRFMGSALAALLWHGIVR